MREEVLVFACIEKNIGDDIFVYLLCKRYPHIKFNIVESANYGTLSRLENLSFDKLFTKWKWASEVGENVPWKAFVGKMIAAFYKVLMGRHKVAVNIVGNAFKNINYTGWNQSRWIRERVGLVDKYYLLSTNFGPYNDPKWKEDFEKIFPLMEDVCFRDKSSFEMFDSSYVRYAPDTVLTLGKMENTPGKNILVSVIDCLFDVRSDAVKACAGEYERTLAETIDYYTDAGYTVTLVNSNTEQDAPASNRIYNSCKNKDKITIFNYDGNVEEVFELYSTANRVIATRLHTIILAWLYGVPVIPFVYDIKVKGILESYNFTGKSFDLKEMKNVNVSDVEDAFANYTFEVDDELLSYAQKQFERLDKELN